MNISLIFLCISLAGLAVVPVYASNGTVVLLVLGVLALSQIKPGLLAFKNSLSTVSGGSLVAFLSWVLISLFWANKESGEIGSAFAIIFLCIAGLVYLTVIVILDNRHAKTAYIVLCIVSTASYLTVSSLSFGAWQSR